jgi:hypothetical protein
MSSKDVEEKIKKSPHHRRSAVEVRGGSLKEKETVLLWRNLL